MTNPSTPRSLLLLLGVACVVGCATADGGGGGGGGGYTVSVRRLSSNPVLSRKNSVFDYTYNPAVFETPGQHWILARCQNYSTPSKPYSVGPSVLAAAMLNGPFLNQSNGVTADQVVFQPSAAFEKCGTEDPRIVQHDGTTYLFYTAYDCTKAALSLATSKDPTNPAAWVRHGPIFPALKWSKSGAAIVRESAPHYLIFGDSTLVPGLRLATSDDLIHWTLVPNKLLIQTRKSSFDSVLVEGGPPPMKLSDGNYFFIYNSAEHGFPSPKPDWDTGYNPGWTVLDGSNPTQVIERAASPLMSPTTPWENGNGTNPVSLTPHVVFVEGMFAVPGTTDKFFIYYGAADSDVGAAEVTVMTPTRRAAMMLQPGN